MIIRQAVVVVALVGLVACGGGNPAPIPSLTPVKTAPPPTEVWSIGGRVTAFGTNAPVSGAHVTASAGATPADTDERQLLRNSYEGPSGTYEVNWRLQESPRVYIRTIDQSGKAIEPEVLDLVRTTLTRGVREWSNGGLSVMTLETGTETRPRSDGWIVVNIIHDYKSRFCGQAFIGVTDGQIELVDDNCTCGSIKIPAAVIVHEVGHALGFWHVSDRNAVMYPTDSGSCAPGQLSDAEHYHAAVAYSRPRWNADPDADDTSTALFQAGPRPPDVLVVN